MPVKMVRNLENFGPILEPLKRCVLYHNNRVQTHVGPFLVEQTHIGTVLVFFTLSVPFKGLISNSVIDPFCIRRTLLQKGALIMFEFCKRGREKNKQPYS